MSAPCDQKPIVAERLAELREYADEDLLDLMYPSEAYALLDVYEAAQKAVMVNAIMNPGAAQTRLNELREALS